MDTNYHKWETGAKLLLLRKNDLYFGFSLCFLFQEVMTSDMEGSKQTSSKQWPDKPSVKYVDFIPAKFFEKGIFQNISTESWEDPFEVIYYVLKSIAFRVVNNSVSFQCT